MAKDTNAVWNEIDVASLSDEQQKAYEVYKTAQRAAAELRVKFEQGMQEGVPSGSKLVFGYRFGKLSAALIADEAKPVKASPAKQSLADFLRSQREAGRAT